MLENTLISITHSQTPIASSRQALKGGDGWCKVACQLNTHIGDLELYISVSVQRWLFCDMQFGLITMALCMPKKI